MKMNTEVLDTLDAVIATSADATEVSNLRKQAYRQATNASLSDDSFLEWNETDEEAKVICIRNAKEELISSMRLTLHFSSDSLFRLFDVGVGKDTAFPIIAIDRATTLQSYRRHGLTNLLRYFALLAFEHSESNLIAFTINEGASRIPVLRKMGYEFELADVSHRTASPYQNTSRVLLATLHKDRLATAKQVSRSQIKQDGLSVKVPSGLLDDLCLLGRELVA